MDFKELLEPVSKGHHKGFSLKKHFLKIDLLVPAFALAMDLFLLPSEWRNWKGELELDATFWLCEGFMAAVAIAWFAGKVDHWIKLKK